MHNYMHVYSSSAVNTICGTIKAVFLSQIFLPFFSSSALYFLLSSPIFSLLPPHLPIPPPSRFHSFYSPFSFAILSGQKSVKVLTLKRSFVFHETNHSSLVFLDTRKCIKIIYRKGFGHFISRSLLTNLFYCCIWEMIK